MTKRRMTMTPEMTKAVNKRVVLDYLLKHSPTSRAEIARALQLSKPTVSAIVAEMVDEGLIREAGFRQSVAGRPGVEIGLNAGSRFAVGVELGVSSSRLIVTDVLARPLDAAAPVAEVRIDTATPEIAAVELSAALSRAVAAAREKLGGATEAGRNMPRLVGIGIGVPAVVNSQTLQVIGSNPLNWTGPAPFGEIVQERMRAPVLVTQRVMAAAWAERVFGAGREVRSLVYARFGSGVAAGIILNDQLFEGASHVAGDIANMTFVPVGVAGEIEQPVALQSLVTREALTARARQLLLDGAHSGSTALDAAGGDLFGITLDALCDGAMRHDPLCRRVVVEAGRYIGAALANVIGILNPPLVVLGGPLTRAEAVLLEAVRDQMKRCCSRYAHAATRIELSGLGELAPALGAASLALRQFLSPTALPDMRGPLAVPVVA